MEKTLSALMSLSLVFFAVASPAQDGLETDTIKTSEGDLAIAFLGHGTLMLSFAGKIVHVDPVSKEADYAKLPKADLVLVTHEHSDHFDLKALAAIETGKTVVVANANAAGQVPGAVAMKNGEIKTVQGIRIEAVPAYNLVHMRSPGNPFHPKGIGNGYILTLGDKRLYLAGDSENTPEMKSLKNIDIAFLPMNLPYTMTPEMVADAARAFRPKILYPYHYGDTDTGKLIDLLKGEKDIEVRIRRMK
ncbi:MAG: metal-dependent hydrolase [Syntrophaceae bacterium PtaU1.Bin231]|nr:MAG: metal-dependent hydrolase [Syntrophaceae bacterium PtaU1.Bin231]